MVYVYSRGVWYVNMTDGLWVTSEIITLHCVLYHISQQRWSQKRSTRSAQKYNAIAGHQRTHIFSVVNCVKKTVHIVHHHLLSEFTYWLPRLIPSKNSEAKAGFLPPQEDIMLLKIWNFLGTQWRGKKKKKKTISGLFYMQKKTKPKKDWYMEIGINYSLGCAARKQSVCVVYWEEM